jgi:cytochrome P450
MARSEAWATSNLEIKINLESSGCRSGGKVSMVARLMSTLDPNPATADVGRPLHEAVGGAIHAATDFLLAGGDPQGGWRDFLTPAGVSDAWVTGFVGAALAGLEDSRARRAAAAAWEFLASRVPEDGGWGYHHGVPSDGDSTLWALRLAARLGQEEGERARRARSFLETHLTEGGLTTYARGEPIRRFMGLPAWFDLGGWCSAHGCVTAAALAVPGLGEALRRTAAGRQEADGSWPAYWWFDREYATGLAASLLAESPEAGDRERALAAARWAAGVVRRRTAPEATPDGAAFAVAWAVRALAAAGGGEPELLEALVAGCHWLVAAQRPDGSWGPSARLRIPRPDVLHPEQVSQWRRWAGMPGGDFTLWAVLGRTFNIWTLDQNGLFTAASVLQALASALGALEATGRQAPRPVTARRPRPADFIPGAPAVVADPYPFYACLRQESPVHFLPAWKAWVLSRFEEVRAALRDPGVFSSAPSQQADRLLLGADPPAHTGVRRQVSRFFNSAAVAALEPRIRALTLELTGRMAEAGQVELMSELALPLPVSIIAELLGLPASRHEDFQRWSAAVVSRATGTGKPSERSLADAQELRAFFQERIAQEVRAPGAGLIGSLLHPPDGGEGLAPEDILSFAILLLIAGTETTTHLLGNSLRLLLERPELRARICAEPALLPRLVEETLRYDTPVQLVQRQTTRPVTLQGVELPAGSRVLLLLGSANRDEAQFPEPDQFDLDRPPQGHLAFGAGPHACLGAHLARLETVTALGALLPLLPRMELAGPVELLASTQLRGPRRLPVQVKSSAPVFQVPRTAG